MRISDWSSDVCSSDLLDGPVHELADSGEGGDVGKARLDVRTRQSEHGPVQIGILAAGELRVESGPELQQGGDAPVDGDLARAWRQRAADQLQERGLRSEEHTSELQSLMRISYAVFCLKKKKNTKE